MLTVYLMVEPLSKLITCIITGLGRQGLASIFTLIAYWVVGIPLTLFYVFELSGGIFAIWLGATLSITFILISSYLIMINTDFGMLAAKAHERRVTDQQSYYML